jgi:hypothetical protein
MASIEAVSLSRVPVRRILARTEQVAGAPWQSAGQTRVEEINALLPAPLGVPSAA